MNRLAAALLLSATITTADATIAYAADMDADFQAFTLIAGASLLSFVAIRVAQRTRRRRWVAGRRAAWGRREREAYGATVPNYPDSIPLDGKPYRHLTVIDGAAVCIPKIAPALSAGEVDTIRAAIRAVDRHV